jgi:hypothetical protein
MADLRKRVQNKGTDFDTETENEGANQDSDAVCRITLFNFFNNFFLLIYYKMFFRIWIWTLRMTNPWAKR